MTTTISVKIDSYKSLVKQAKCLIGEETNLIANLSNITSLVHYTFDFWWSGFYLLDDNELVLGPFQGPVACTRIGYGKGVCGTAWQTNKVQIIPNVHEFPGHIACNAESNSELVIPFTRNNVFYGVFDIDSKKFDNFDEIDAQYLSEILNLLN